MKAAEYGSLRSQGRQPTERCRRLLIPRIEIFAGGGRRGHALGTRAMRPAAPARETLAAAALFIPAGVGNHRLRLRLRLILRLRTRLALLALAMMLARLLVALIGLAVAALFTW